MTAIKAIGKDIMLPDGSIATLSAAYAGAGLLFALWLATGLTS